MKTLTPKLIVPTGPDPIHNLFISSDNKLILSHTPPLSWSNYIQLWNRQGKFLDKITLAHVNNICFSNDGSQYLTLAIIEDKDEDKLEFCLYSTEYRVAKPDAYAPTPIKHGIIPLGSSTFTPSGVKFSKDDSKIIVFGNKVKNQSKQRAAILIIALIDVETREIQKPLIEIPAAREISSIYISEKKIIAIDYRSNKLFPIDLVTHEIAPSIEFPVASGTKVVTIQLLQDGEKAVVFGENQQEKLVGLIFNLSKPESHKLSLPEALDTESSITVMHRPSTGLIAAAFSSNKILLYWDDTTFELQEPTVKLNDRFSKSVFSPDGSLLIGWKGPSNSDGISIMDLTSRQIDGTQRKDHLIQNHKLTPDGQTMFLLTHYGDQRFVKVFDLMNELPVRTFEGRNAMDISAKGDFLIAGSGTNDIQLWDLITKEHNVVRYSEYRTRLLEIKISPEGNSCAIGYIEYPDHNSKGKIRVLLLDLESIRQKSPPLTKDDTFQGIFIKMRKISETYLSIDYSSDGIGLCLGFDRDYFDVIKELDKQGFPTKTRDYAHGEKRTLYSPSDPELILYGTIFTDQNLGISFKFKDGQKNYNNLHHHIIRSLNLNISTFTNPFESVVRFRDSSTGLSQEIGRLYILDEDDWAVITPSGVFDASPGAMKMMYYVVGLEIIELDQLKERYWQPGLLPVLLNHVEGAVKDVEAFEEVPLFPSIQSANISDKELTIKIKERNGGIGRISLRINNKEQAQDINPDRKTVFTHSLEPYERFFEPGKNVISIRCWNEEDWLPGPHHDLEYLHESADENSSPGALYTLFVGTSKYQNNSLSLHFPDQDATYLNEAVKIVGQHLFENAVYTTLLTTETPGSEAFSSKQNIKRSFEALAGRGRPQDVVVIYFSGHGANYDDGRRAQYYYLTHEVVSANLSDRAVRKKTTISSDELTGWINAIPARKQVLIFDTCYSGKIVESLKSKNAVDATRDRAMERMKDRTGMYVLTGSAADKVSYEASNYGQGLLTYTLLQGIKGAALMDRANQAEKSVDVMTLFSHSREEVERLSKEFLVVQRPTLRAPLNVESFDIGIAPEKARRQIKLALPKPVFERSNFMNEESFLDDLDISETLDQYLSGSIGIGHRPKAIFIDVVNFPGAHHVRGLYNSIPDGYLVKGKIYKDRDLLGDFEVTGKGMEDIVPKIAREVELVAFPIDDYEIPDDEEVGIEEKGRQEDLEALRNQPGYGYNAGFIGSDYRVEMPKLTPAQKRDRAKSHDGEHVLNYQYYSVVQCKSRKFPFFAACNLHGGQFIRLGRAGTFIRDRRLPDEDQWKDEFYTYAFDPNNSHKYTKIFHRGHMTKREDAQWGTDPETAERGAKLTFFFTNAVPQHGRLNAVVWRGLEDYIMHIATDGKKAKGDEGYKINIFTGPVFQKDDPALPIADGQVQIPTLFWKVIYFRKRSDGKLYYIGFMMGQKKLLATAFADFGIRAKEVKEATEPFLDYKEKEVFQVQISIIEEKTKMKFHKAIDPLAGSENGRQISEVIPKLKKKGIDRDTEGLSYEFRGLTL